MNFKINIYIKFKVKDIEDSLMYVIIMKWKWIES